MTAKLSSYSLLQLKMKEVDKSKNKTRVTKSTNSTKPNNSKESKKVPGKKQPPPPDPSKEAHRQNPNVPDRSFGDYFCKICDSHMNSDAMWEAHITGKRHIKNVKKGDTDSKYEELDEESFIKSELRNVKDPIIGLDYIHEIRRKDPAVPAMYNCFLCHASIATVPLVIEHVIGLKHRLNFIRENESGEFEQLVATNLKKNQLEPLVANSTAKLEARLGRGYVKVKVEKPKPTIPYKRNYESDDDDDRVAWKKTSKPHKPEEAKLTVWSSLDIPKRDDRESDNRRREKDYYDDRDDLRNKRSYRNSVSPDRNRSRRSERDNYSRSYADDYPSRSTTYPTDYLRSELSRFSYDRSPERDRLTSISARKDDYYGSSSTHTSSRLESDARSLQTQIPAGTGPSSTQQNPDPTSIFKKFISQLMNLPTEHFLKMVLMKLEDMSELNKAELELLMKVFSNCQQVICNNLPPQIQALFKDKLAQQSAENFHVNSSASNAGHSSAAQSRMPQSGQSSEDKSNKFVNDINELLFGARKASETSSDNQQSRSTTYDHSPNIPPASSHYSGSAPATNFPPPPSFQPQSSNFVLPPSNFQQPSTNYPASSNSFQPPPASFQPPPARFQPPTNEFTSPTNNASNEFTSSSNVMSSYSSYAPYDTTPPASGIPGLTLAEHDSSHNQNYSQYKWTAPNSNNRDLSNFSRY